MRLAALAFALLAAAPTGASAATAAPVASAAPQAPAEIGTRAKEWLGRMQSGNVDRAQLSPKMTEQYTDDIRTTLVNEIGPMGAIAALTLKDVKHKDGNTGYLFAVTFASGSTADYVFAVEDATGKVSGLSFTPTP